MGGTMTSRELAYVQATRARESTWLFADRLTAGDDLADLAKSMSRSKGKQLAHDVVDDAAHGKAINRHTGGGRSRELSQDLHIER